MEGASNDIVRGHPVLFKITTLKKTLDGLHGLDSKLESVLKRKLQGKNLSLLGKRPEPENAEDGKDDASERSEAASQSVIGALEDEESDDKEMGNDMDDNVVETDALLTRTEQRSLETAQVEALQSRISKLKKDDLKSIVKSSNAPKTPKVKPED